MKIWLDENYNIEKEEERNFGKGNNYFDYIDLFIPITAVENDNTLPTFNFELSTMRKYGPFNHDSSVDVEDNYVKFRIHLSDSVLSENGKIIITITINYFNSENKIYKTRNITTHGNVLDNVTIEGDAFIITGNEQTVLESMQQKINSLTNVYKDLNSDYLTTRNDVIKLKDYTLNFGRKLKKPNTEDGSYANIEEAYQAGYSFFNIANNADIISLQVNQYSHIFYKNQKDLSSFIDFSIDEKKFFYVKKTNEVFAVESLFVETEELNIAIKNILDKIPKEQFYIVNKNNELNKLPKKAIENYAGIIVKEGSLFLKYNYANNRYYYYTIQPSTHHAVSYNIYIVDLSEEKEYYALVQYDSTIINRVEANLQIDEDQEYQALNNLKVADTILKVVDYKPYIDEKYLTLENQQNTNKEQLQIQIDGINAGQNLADIVSNYSSLSNYNTSNLLNNDKIQVLQDENHNNAATIYSWNGNYFQFVGEVGQSYSKAQIDNILNKYALKSDFNNADLTTKIINFGKNINMWNSYIVDGNELRTEVAQIRSVSTGALEFRNLQSEQITFSGKVNQSFSSANFFLPSVAKDYYYSLPQKDGTIALLSDLYELNPDLEQINQMKEEMKALIQEETEQRISSDEDLGIRIDGILGTNDQFQNIESAYIEAKAYTNTQIENVNINVDVTKQDLQNQINAEVQARKDAISNLINNSPEALDTLYELSQALGNDPNFATTITNYIGTKYNESISYTNQEVSSKLDVENGESFSQTLYGPKETPNNFYSTKFKITIVPDAEGIGTIDNELYFKEIIKYICSKFKNYQGYTFCFVTAPNARSVAQLYIYDTSNLNSDGLPKHSFGSAMHYEGTNIYFGTQEYSYYYNSFNVEEFKVVVNRLSFLEQHAIKIEEISVSGTTGSFQEIESGSSIGYYTYSGTITIDSNRKIMNVSISGVNNEVSINNGVINYTLKSFKANSSVVATITYQYI